MPAPPASDDKRYAPFEDPSRKSPMGFGDDVFTAIHIRYRLPCRSTVRERTEPRFWPSGQVNAPLGGLRSSRPNARAW